MTKIYIIAKAFLILLLVGCSGADEHTHTVKSAMMRPTFEPGDKVHFDSVDQESIKRFDLLVVKTPVIDITYIFRVIGLPGEKLKLTDEGIFIDGEILTLPAQVNYSLEGKMPMYIEVGQIIDIPPGRYFVIGDDMTVSRDSRTFGLVSVERILGKVRHER